MSLDRKSTTWAISPGIGHVAKFESGSAFVLDTWCPEGDLNPHDRLRSADFKSAVSADFTIRAVPLPSTWYPTHSNGRWFGLILCASERKPSGRDIAPDIAPGCAESPPRNPAFQSRES